MPWRLAISIRAERDISGLPAKDQNAVLDALARLPIKPGDVDLKKLAGREGVWRLRVGNWRAILELDKAEGIIMVVRVLPRRDAYR